MEKSEILKYFEYKHLPPRLQLVSHEFYVLAHAMDANLPSNEEKEVTLRKLLEAKDAAVRSAL